MIELRIPCSTYRLQFNSSFKFEDARSIVSYLDQLGITDIYSSPILKARKGSSHGYDVVDPLCLNPELGTEQQFQSLVSELKHRKMGLLLDIVPNHMAADIENPWWADVLENGYASPYADFFDIDWFKSSADLCDKVLLPVLGAPLKEVLKNQELNLALENDCLLIKYYERKFPLDIKSYGFLINSIFNKTKSELYLEKPITIKIQNLLNEIDNLPQQENTDSEVLKTSYTERQRIKRKFSHLIDTTPVFREYFIQCIQLFNNNDANTNSGKILEEVLSLQAYQLAYWKTGLKDINYRRFFDVSDLIGIRVEEQDVFQTTHSLIQKLILAEEITGLRIDHIDGLREPDKYLQQLQQIFIPDEETSSRSPNFFIIVEKILTDNEILAKEWPVYGTTGYDFLKMLNYVFVNKKGFEILKDAYFQMINMSIDFKDVLFMKKKQVMDELFASEIKSLSNFLLALALIYKDDKNIKENAMVDAFKEITACLPVYRTYIKDFRISPNDRQYIQTAIEESKKRNPENNSSLQFLEKILLLDFPSNITQRDKQIWLSLIMRWQQFTGAIMAKGLEDTALYNYHPLISLNDVGSKPVISNKPDDAFHKFNLSQQRYWPHTINATSTHDTKRSEDVRARINVLSEIPDEWSKRVREWSKNNSNIKKEIDGNPVPEPVMELLLYQTLVGAWPLYQNEIPSFKTRLESYLFKAAREAKTFTRWTSPKVEYERALIEFTEAILDDTTDNVFKRDFLKFQKYIAYYGFINSLSQILLKSTSPGVPDFYQGTELWDFSLVDPDNRRPVDYAMRYKLLDNLKGKEAKDLNHLIKEILNTWEDGRVKLFVTYKLLNLRNKYSGLFSNGEYIPLQTKGEKQKHIFTFARKYNTVWSIITIPRFLTNLISVNELPLGKEVWGSDYIILPPNMPSKWKNIFTEEIIQLESPRNSLPISQIFSMFPVALLIPT